MKKFATLISVIATIAIAWYLFTYYSVINTWWSLPLLAGATGLLSVILPLLIRRFKPLWSIIATGFTLLIMQILPFFSTYGESTKFWGLTIIILVIAMITEALAHGISILHIGEFILDLIISIAAAWLITTFETPITTVVLLLITFISTLVIDFNFEFSLKRNSRDVNDETDEESDATVE